jgi:hypothetical protein
MIVLNGARQVRAFSSTRRAGVSYHDLPTPAVAAILARHAPAAAWINSFYWRLFGGEMLVLLELWS